MGMVEATEPSDGLVLKVAVNSDQALVAGDRSSAPVMGKRSTYRMRFAFVMLAEVVPAGSDERSN
jgi:hypothetical protein